MTDLQPIRVNYASGFDWQPSVEVACRIEAVEEASHADPSFGLLDVFDRAVHCGTSSIQLSQLVTTGDRVAIALDPSTPCLMSLLPLLLAELARLGASIGDTMITIPSRNEILAESIRTWLASSSEFSTIKVMLHTQEDRGAIAYIGATALGHPIYFAKALVEADVVIPLFSTASMGEAAQGTLARFLYQGFAFVESGEPDVRRPSRQRKERNFPPAPGWSQEAEEALWQLGILYGIAVSPGRSGAPVKITAGSQAELESAIKSSTAAWARERTSPAQLVLAELSGGAEQQNWDAAARAVRTASEVTASEGIVVLLTDLVLSENDRRAKRRAESSKGKRSQEVESGIAIFLKALEDCRGSRGIFLRSRLSEEDTEELGMGYLSKPAELDRLLEKHSRSILIRDAQHVRFHAAKPMLQSNLE